MSVESKRAVVEDGDERCVAAEPNSVRGPLLVTGVAGVPGLSAVRHFRRRLGGRVIGTRRPDHWPLQGPGIVACDLADADAVARLWQQHRFASVLSAAGSCRLKSCELDPAMARRVNVDTTRNVIRQAARHGARVIHLSIDLVFAGRPGGRYREHESPDPVTVYGAMMADAEEVVRTLAPDATILRISLPMGESFNGHAGAIDWIASRFRQGKPATLYYDEIRTPTYVGCLNRLIGWLLEHPMPGTYHAGGPRQLSLYQIAQIVNVVGGFDPDLLRGCYRHDAGPVPPRAGNVTLDSTALAAATGFVPFDPWPRHPELIPVGRGWHLDRTRQDLQSLRRRESLSIESLYHNPLTHEPHPPDPHPSVPEPL